MLYLTDIVLFPWIHVTEKGRMVRILEEYARGIHMADAFLLVLSEEFACDIFTFDKKLLNAQKRM